MNRLTHLAFVTLASGALAGIISPCQAAGITFANRTDHSLQLRLNEDKTTFDQHLHLESNDAARRLPLVPDAQLEITLRKDETITLHAEGGRPIQPAHAVFDFRFMTAAGKRVEGQIAFNFDPLKGEASLGKRPKHPVDFKITTAVDNAMANYEFIRSHQDSVLSLCPFGESPFELTNLEELRTFINMGRTSGSHFHSIRYPVTILADREVNDHGFEKRKQEADGTFQMEYRRGARSDRETTPYFESFLRRLGPSVQCRWAVAGDLSGLQITPQSGVPAQTFFLVCKKSVIQPGHTNADRLKLRFLVAAEPGTKDPLAPMAVAEDLLASLEGGEQEFLSRCLGLMENPALNFNLNPATDNPVFALNPLFAYAEAVQRNKQPQGVVVMVGRGQLSARPGWQNMEGSIPFKQNAPMVYTIDTDPATIPDLVADIRNLKNISSIKDRSVDQFYFDGVTYNQVYTKELAEGLARKLKPGGRFISTYNPDKYTHTALFKDLLLAHGFEGPIPFPAEENCVERSPAVGFCFRLKAQ